jgi:hypothetical protein
VAYTTFQDAGGAWRWQRGEGDPSPACETRDAAEADAEAAIKAQTV